MLRAETRHDADFHLTVSADAAKRGGRATRTVFDEVAAKIRASGAEPIAEKIYGRVRAKDRILAARRAAFMRRGLDVELPATFVEGRPVHGGDLAGVQVWGIRAGSLKKNPVTTVRHRAGGVSRSWEDEGSRFLYLSSVQGTARDDRSPANRPRQAERMYRNAALALRELDASFADVVRTWIYLRDITAWYGKFNAVRSGLFRSADFLGKRRLAVPPASTGIEGRDSRGECLMDLLAVIPGPRGTVRVEPIVKTSRQGSALSYGSAFSRGIVLQVGKKRTVYVSGTASIDAAGASLHPDDPELQALETLMNIAALLAERGGGLADIVSATLFCKDRRAFEAYHRVRRLLSIPEIPVVAVLADVCRPDLLVEIEAVAVLGG